MVNYQVMVHSIWLTQRSVLGWMGLMQYSQNDWNDQVEDSLIIYQNQLAVPHMVHMQGYLYIPQNDLLLILELDIIDEYHCSIRYQVANLVYEKSKVWLANNKVIVVLSYPPGNDEILSSH